MVTTTKKSDFLVLGSGIAGLSFALKVADKGTVTIVTKKENYESNTNYAQGGMAAVLSGNDSFDLHTKDTLRCGVGLSKREAVEVLVREGPRLVKELLELGVKFSRDEGTAEGLALGMEGGHSRRRIVHANDLTGREVEKVLLAAALKHPAITLIEHCIGVELIVEEMPKTAAGRTYVCHGAHVLNTQTRKFTSVIANHTLLATGGCGKVYLYTSNPDIATGDGLAMAFRAGAALANLEFVQFHPTCLFHPEAKSFLISEAVRGEGAVVTTNDGKPFLEKYHELGNLAPRDIVARAIDREMKMRGDRHVLLDMRPIGKERIPERFPYIYSRLISLGLDPTREPIPVVPAAHYMCGGVITDLYGRTTVERLYACGEVACTGVHGANRLASNSLPEALVFAERAARSALSSSSAIAPEIPKFGPAPARTFSEIVAVKHDWQVLRKLMWDYVGIVRSDERLYVASKRVAVMRETIEDYYSKSGLSSDLIELRNIGLVAELIVRCAMWRKESRGLHYNLDHPRKNDREWKRDTVLSKDEGFSCMPSYDAWAALT